MKKSHRKEVWFTEEEWEYITKCADECGMKVGTYIQIMAVRGKIVKFDFADMNYLKGVFDRYKNTFDEIVFDTQKHLMELDKIKNEILKLKG